MGPEFTTLRSSITRSTDQASQAPPELLNYSNYFWVPQVPPHGSHGLGKCLVVPCREDHSRATKDRAWSFQSPASGLQICGPADLGSRLELFVVIAASSCAPVGVPPPTARRLCSPRWPESEPSTIRGAPPPSWPGSREGSGPSPGNRPPLPHLEHTHTSL